jgi:hypothetical protein
MRDFPMDRDFALPRISNQFRHQASRWPSRCDCHSRPRTLQRFARRQVWGANGHRDCRRPARKGATDIVLAAPAEFQRKPRQCCALRPDSGNSDCRPVCAATEPGRVWEDRLSDPIRVRNVPCRDAPPAHLAAPARSRGARGCPSCGGWRVLAPACILIGPARAVMRPYRSWPRWIMECAHARRSRRRS